MSEKEFVVGDIVYLENKEDRENNDTWLKNDSEDKEIKDKVKNHDYGMVPSNTQNINRVFSVVDNAISSAENKEFEYEIKARYNINKKPFGEYIYLLKHNKETLNDNTDMETIKYMLAKGKYLTKKNLSDKVFGSKSCSNLNIMKIPVGAIVKPASNLTKAAIIDTKVGYDYNTFLDRSTNKNKEGKKTFKVVKEEDSKNGTKNINGICHYTIQEEGTDNILTIPYTHIAINKSATAGAVGAAAEAAVKRVFKTDKSCDELINKYKKGTIVKPSYTPKDVNNLPQNKYKLKEVLNKFYNHWNEAKEVVKMKNKNYEGTVKGYMVVQDLSKDNQECKYRITCTDPNFNGNYLSENFIPHKYVTSDKTQNTQLKISKYMGKKKNTVAKLFTPKKKSSGGMKTEKKRKNGKNKTFSKKTRN